MLAAQYTKRISLVCRRLTSHITSAVQNLHASNISGNIDNKHPPTQTQGARFINPSSPRFRLFQHWPLTRPPMALPYRVGRFFSSSGALRVQAREAVHAAEAAVLQLPPSQGGGHCAAPHAAQVVLQDQEHHLGVSKQIRVAFRWRSTGNQPASGYPNFETNPKESRGQNPWFRRGLALWGDNCSVGLSQTLNLSAKLGISDVETS